MNEEGIVIFVIYKHPKDYPEGWIVRRWVGEQPDLIPAKAHSLEEARTLIPQGMVRFQRKRDDDESIFESWL